MLDFFD